jgi:hypothetical protein
MEKEEQKQYLESLLEWCNDTYSEWVSAKSRYSKQFDLRSVEEWEESYHELKEKIQADLKENFDHFQKAKDLHDRLNIFYTESQGIQKEVELSNS